jgi:hypothetical protein
MITKRQGANRTARHVDAIIPLKTVMPIDLRALAPAPECLAKQKDKLSPECQKAVEGAHQVNGYGRWERLNTRSLTKPLEGYSLRSTSRIVRNWPKQGCAVTVRAALR